MKTPQKMENCEFFIINPFENPDEFENIKRLRYV